MSTYNLSLDRGKMSILAVRAQQFFLPSLANLKLIQVSAGSENTLID